MKYKDRFTDRDEDGISVEEEKEDSLQSIATEVHYLLTVDVSAAEILNQVLVVINEFNEEK